MARYGVASKDQVIIITAPNTYFVLRDGKIEYLPVIGYYIQVRHGMPSSLQVSPWVQRFKVQRRLWLPKLPV